MPHASPVPEDQIAALRDFNRFYTRQIGLLDETLLPGDFSLTEARVLYELANRAQPAAAEIARDLGLDAGYLSRILKRFETAGLLSRAPSVADSRQAVLTLTPTGLAAFQPLNRASQEGIGALLDRLPSGERTALLKACARIRAVLGPPEERKAPYLLRPYQTGDLGWISHRQGLLYAEEYGWDDTYEALVAEILAAFVRNFDARHERAWIAERDGEIVGSVFLVRESDKVAKLRLLYVEPAARGLGIGQRLVQECVRFARLKGYATMTLWTNDILTSARRIYQATGFRLVAEEQHHSFGKDLVGQNWALDLRAGS